jgi:hypothetical protein
MQTRRYSASKWFVFAVVHRRTLINAALLLVICGCSSSDKRVNVSGNVTWKGQPVPAGFIVFDPDVKNGNIGPQGMAPIQNGKYDTRSSGGRPITPGEVRATIQGFDGQVVNQDHKKGKRIFMPIEVVATVPQTSGTLDLKVPDSAEALH